MSPECTKVQRTTPTNVPDALRNGNRKENRKENRSLLNPIGLTLSSCKTEISEKVTKMGSK